MSIEDVKNGGPANWYVGTEAAIRDNRGDMGERGVKISPSDLLKGILKEISNYSPYPILPDYYDVIRTYWALYDPISARDTFDNGYAFGFLEAMAKFCPERLEK